MDQDELKTNFCDWIWDIQIQGKRFKYNANKALTFEACVNF